ncbi:hypothetical protein ABBQ32_006105 [Trebouxia sp. C0010 RCD-2024]
MLAVDSSLEKHRAVIDRMQVFRPVVSHQQVRADRDLFYTALKQLHELLGGQLRVPNVALKQLDLHLLYKEVTEEGGLERVVHKKLWGKVCAPFQFPASYTSRSFSMKQHYVKLLYDFEEVYFHQYSGPLPVPLIDDFKLDDSQRKRTKHSEDPPTASTVYVIAKEPLQGAPNRSGQRKDEPVCPVIARKGRNASANPSAPISMPPAFTGFHHGQAIQNGDSLIGALVTGHVDSKIDCGYFITIFINGYSFQGVLYQPPKPASESGGSNLPIVVPTPKDVPPQTLRPSSPLDDYYSSEPDKDDQVHAADLTATECAQAFPVDPGMSFTDSMQLDSTSSFEQAEPLPVDPALVSPLHQEGMSDVREDWSKIPGLTPPQQDRQETMMSNLRYTRVLHHLRTLHACTTPILQPVNQLSTLLILQIVDIAHSGPVQKQRRWHMSTTDSCNFLSVLSPQQFTGYRQVDMRVN